MERSVMRGFRIPDFPERLPARPYSISTVVFKPFNAIHDAEYTPAADTRPLRLDGQQQKA
jgi:hypothetical protein